MEYLRKKQNDSTQTLPENKGGSCYINLDTVPVKTLQYKQRKL